jgi:heme-degrading monooxygenase HmoA
MTVAFPGDGEDRGPGGDAAGASPPDERSGGMYARSTTIRGNPPSMNDGIGYVRDEAMPAVRQMDGNVGLSMLADRDTGRCIITTSWADAEALNRSADGVRAMRQRTAEIMGGDAEVDEWEIAVLHRMHEAHNGACARVIWSRGDPAQMDRMLDGFRMSMVPRMEDLPGFCSCSVMVDRDTGRIATSVTYDSRPSMDEARQTGMSLRQEFSRQTGTQITDAAAFDVVLAHLRVPETV